MTIDTNPRRALDFGIQRSNSRNSGFLFPIPNGRSLLKAQSLEMKSYCYLTLSHNYEKLNQPIIALDFSNKQD